MRFLLQEGIAIIPKSVTPSRIIENSQVSVQSTKANFLAKINKKSLFVLFNFICHGRKIPNGLSGHSFKQIQTRDRPWDLLRIRIHSTEK